MSMSGHPSIGQWWLRLPWSVSGVIYFTFLALDLRILWMPLYKHSFNAHAMLYVSKSRSRRAGLFWDFVAYRIPTKAVECSAVRSSSIRCKPVEAWLPCARRDTRLSPGRIFIGEWSYGTRPWFHLVPFVGYETPRSTYGYSFHASALMLRIRKMKDTMYNLTIRQTFSVFVDSRVTRGMESVKWGIAMYI